MPLIDDLIREVDVDAALADVLDRNETDRRRHRRVSVVLAAACVLAVVGVAWLAWPSTDQDQNVDVIGRPDATGGEYFRAEITVQVEQPVLDDEGTELMTVADVAFMVQVGRVPRDVATTLGITPEQVQEHVRGIPIVEDGSVIVSAVGTEEEGAVELAEAMARQLVQSVNDQALEAGVDGEVAVVAGTASVVGISSEEYEETLEGNLNSPGSPDEPSPASATAVGPTGMRINLAVDDDHVAVGGSITVTMRVVNEGEETITGAYGIDCPSDLRVELVTAAGALLGSLHGNPIEWDGDPAGLHALVTAPPPRAFYYAPRARPLPVDLDCRSPSGVQLDPGEDALSRGDWDAWFSPGELATSDFVVRVTGRPDCEGCGLLPPVVVELPITIDDGDRPAPPTAGQIEAALARDDVQAFFDEVGPVEHGSEPATYDVLMVQTEMLWLLRIHGDDGAADIWFVADGPLAGDVAQVDRLEENGVLAEPPE